MYSMAERKNSECACNKKSSLTESDMGSEKYIKDLNSNNDEEKPVSDPDKEELIVIRSRFPMKVPVILRKYKWDKDLPLLNKMKYLVPKDITMSQFQMIIRNRMQLHPNKSLYFLVKERSIVSCSMTMAQVYKEFAEDDGYLYITYASQETFGSNSSEMFYSRNKRLT